MMSGDWMRAEAQVLDQRRPTERAPPRRPAGDARNPAESPAARANRPPPTGLPPPSIGTTCALPRRRRRVERGRGCGDRRGDRRVGPTHGCRDSRASQVRLEFVAGPIPALVGDVATHHHRGAVLARHRDVEASGPLALHQVAERRHAQMERRDLVVESRSCPARFRPPRNRQSCRRARRFESAHALEMIPVRAGWSPVRIVEWPGQVSVVAWLSIAVAIRHARRDPRQPAGELRAIFVEQVGRKLVDRDDDEQLGRRPASARPIATLDRRPRCKDLRTTTNPPRHPGESRGLLPYAAEEMAIPDFAG